MVLLWRDPEGNTVSVSAAANNSIPTQTSPNEQLMITLKKSIGEKDVLIANLKSEISALKEVSFICCFDCCADSYSHVFHSYRRMQLALSVQKIEGFFVTMFVNVNLYIVAVSDNKIYL